MSDAISDDELLQNELAGEITHVLRFGSPAERASLLRTIEKLSGAAERERIQAWMADGFPEPENLATEDTEDTEGEV